MLKNFILRFCAPGLLLLIALALAAPSLARAQAPPITLAVRAGYEGVYRPGEWFPVVVDVANDGPDINGELEWSFPAQPGEPVFRRQVDLPRGSRKRVTLDVYAQGFARNGQVRLLQDGTELATQDAILDGIDESVFLVGVVSADPTLLASLDALQQGPGFSDTRVRHLAPGDLPESAGGLRALNALFLHDVDTAALSPAQREAIALWVSTGGRLAVSGGPDAPKVAAGLADLLPVQLGSAVRQADLAPLAKFAGVSVAPPSAAVIEAQPLPTAEQIAAGAGLLFRREYGAGVVIFSAFDLASLRGWAGETALWGRLITSFSPPGRRISQIDLLSGGGLKLPSLNLPATTTLLVFLLGYVLIIGPLNYIALRRLRRLEWAWLSVPLIVLLFAAGLYVVGRGLRGGEVQINQAAVVQSVEGQPRGFATAFVGLFSPRRATYTVGFPAGALVRGQSRRSILSGQSDALTIDSAGAPAMTLLADVSSMTTLVADTAVDMPVSIQSSLTNSGATLSGEVRNTGTIALENALIVRRDQFTRIGTLAPGASGRVAGRMEQGFPRAASLPDSGVYNLQQILNELFDRDPSGLGYPVQLGAPINLDGVYLLAWSRQPSISASLDGQPADQSGVTLYVIRLPIDLPPPPSSAYPPPLNPTPTPR